MIAMPLPYPIKKSHSDRLNGIRISLANGEYAWYKINDKVITQKNYDLELWVRYLNAKKNKHPHILKYEIINL